MTAAAMPALLFRERWPGRELSRDYAPRFSDSNKNLLYQIAGGVGAEGDTNVAVSRWAASAIPELRWSHPLRLATDPGYYRYQAVHDKARLEWYVNFADAQLFGFYGSSLFAQDEMQVAEHPILGSVREKLSALSRSDKRYAPRTRDQNGSPTPVLLSGVERRIAIDTSANAEAGRPAGLYGNRMARASSDVIKRATRKLEPPTYTNLLAIEAPKGGGGEDTRDQISDALHTAFTGFAAVRAESIESDAAIDTIVIHSGNWGCGAFGGNVVLMVTVQMLAGLWAGIDELIFYDVQPEGWELALEHYSKLKDSQVQFDGVLEYLLDQNFRWGVPNGT
jgi:hypothetical protein